MKYLFALLTISIIISGCKKEDSPTSNTLVTVKDADMFALLDSTIGMVYKNGDSHWSAVRYAKWINKYGSVDYGPVANIDINRVQNKDYSQINDWEMGIHKLGFSHILPPYGIQQYYELIGKYNQFKFGWDTYSLDSQGIPISDNGAYDNMIPQQMKDYAVQRAKASNYSYYKNTLAIISRSTGSGHTAQPLLRTRYNLKAATQLDASGKVKIGAIFPDSSLIVKELMKVDSTIEVYAFMFKLKGASNSDANGWVWGEATALGVVAYSVSNKSSGCNNCHSTGIDYTRMNDSHP